jgi:multidrug efflux pump subunit AcrA (membrane-fusion protein)
MFHRKPIVDNSSLRRGVALLAVTFILIAAAPRAMAQKGAARKPKTGSAKATPQISKEDMKKLAEAASQSRANLLSASSAYRESLEKLLELQRQDEARTAEIVGKRKELLDLGVISKRDLEDGERALAEAQGKVAETTKRIADVDNLVAEVNTAEELAKTSAERPGLYRSTGLVIRYAGASRWALGDIAKVDAFFRLKFARPLPVSAVGQTVTHNQLGFDHREAADVALHPDSAEGQALIGYLTSQGVSFIAIRGAIPGSATGAHIHIGPPSRRVSSH